MKDMRVTSRHEIDPLEQLYRQHGDRLWRSVFAYAGDRDIADDAVAEAFTQAMGAIARGAELRDPLRWIWRVSFRVAAGQLKDRRRRTAYVEHVATEMEPMVDLVRTLAKLSPKQRAAIILHHYAGYPTNEIADMIGSTTSAVRVHLSVGRRRLRTLLDEEGIDDA
jgi:RNA polymerase sigma-70 factor, ECF subfamily